MIMYVIGMFNWYLMSGLPLHRIFVGKIPCWSPVCGGAIFGTFPNLPPPLSSTRTCSNNLEEEMSPGSQYSIVSNKWSAHVCMHAQVLDIGRRDGDLTAAP